MSRKTKYNKIVTPELWSHVSKENKDLMEDFLMYLRSIQRSESTIKSYKNDLEIIMVWLMQNTFNKAFVEMTKRDIVAFQNYLLHENGNSPARVRRLKAVMSSLANYVEAILDEEYPKFKNIIRKVENPAPAPVREKSVFTKEDLEVLLNYLVERKEYQRACVLALAMCSGSRKSELTRFKVNYFKPENIIYGSLYKTPEKMKTKGRGQGKFIHRYVMVKEFQPYLDLWLQERWRLGIRSPWLFVAHNGVEWKQISISCLNGWAHSFGKVLNRDFYFHSMRHYFTTLMAASGLPTDIIQEIVGWDSADMVKLYNDTTTDAKLEKFFDENGIKTVAAASLSDL